MCRTGSLRAAAEATGFTQPGLSRQVAALEREVGVRLLHRGSRGVTPTAAGAALLPHARLLVNEARRGREAARTATEQTGHDRARRGAVGDGGAGAAGHREAPRHRRSRGHDRSPGSPPSSDPWSSVASSTRPWSPTRRPASPATRSSARPTSATTRWSSSRRPGTALAGADRIGIERLADETWIEDNAGSEVMLRQLAARARFEPRISTMADDLLAKTGMVAAGLGVALVPDLLVPSLRADLTVLRLKRPTYRGIYLISRTDRTDLGPLVDALGVG